MVIYVVVNFFDVVKGKYQLETFFPSFPRCHLPYFGYAKGKYHVNISLFDHKPQALWSKKLTTTYITLQIRLRGQ